MESSSPQKSVYFLGAGASKASDFKLPTMGEFFTEKDFKSDNYPELHKFIKRVFHKTPIEKLNLEDVVTRLELSIDRFGAFGEHPEPYLHVARREFDRYVHERLSYKPVNGNHKCQKHEVLLGQMKDKDSIITLNYDLVVDYTLYEISKSPEGKLPHGCLLDRMYSLLGKTTLIHGERPSLYYSDFGVGHYLKLHGSIDWLYCSHPPCGNHQLFFPNPVDWKEETHNSPGEPCILCGSPLVSVIIPPTMNKTFIEYPKLGLLWTLAWKEIRAADKLVLIGMSLPESDYYLKWLINSAISAREKPPLIGVVNRDETVREKRDETVREKIKKLVGESPEYLGDFCKYIEDIKTA